MLPTHCSVCNDDTNENDHDEDDNDDDDNDCDDDDTDEDGKGDTEDGWIQRKASKTNHGRFGPTFPRPRQFRALLHRL